MKAVQINAVCSAGSTGRICASISRTLTRAGIENYILYSLGSAPEENAIRYATNAETKAAALQAHLLGNWGFEGSAATKRLLRHLERIRPEVLHLHNLHSHACRLDLLFDWVRRRGVRVIWTFHDCWAFTGYCTHYDHVGCTRWRSGCGKCPQRGEYSWLLDRSGSLLEKKKAALSGLELTVVTPSAWLADQVRQSFLGAYPIQIIHNGIDLSVFRPSSGDFRARYGLEGKRVLLGVASAWNEKKGLDVLIEMSRRLDDSYRLVLVGTDGETDRLLPPSVLSVHRTKDQTELAGIYSAADLFLNPTREDSFPTVNLEALACGTPVLSFRTGGSPESLRPDCGAVVEKDDLKGFLAQTRRICETAP